MGSVRELQVVKVLSARPHPGLGFRFRGLEFEGLGLVRSPFSIRLRRHFRVWGLRLLW